MMKEANPPQAKGTAAGVMNFRVFVTSGIISLFISHLMISAPGVPLTLHEFQNAFLPLVGGVVVAIVLSFFMRETGSSAHLSEKQEAMVMLPHPAIP